MSRGRKHRTPTFRSLHVQGYRPSVIARRFAPIVGTLISIAAGGALWNCAGASRPVIAPTAAAAAGGSATIVDPGASGDGQQPSTSLDALPHRFTPGGRAALLARIAQGPRDRRADGDGQIAGDIDKDYLKTQIRALTPLLQECYERALERSPSLAGKLVVDLAIEGAPDAGALVTDCTIAPTSTIQEPGLSECVRETMLSLELPAPVSWGRIRVRYPFVFRTAAPDAGP